MSSCWPLSTVKLLWKDQQRLASTLKTHQKCQFKSKFVVEFIKWTIKNQTWYFLTITWVNKGVFPDYLTKISLCCVWFFVVWFMSLSPKNGPKGWFCEFWRSLSLFWTIKIHWKEEIRKFPMHIWNCCVSHVANIASYGIFSFSIILRFHRAKHDPMWTLYFTVSEIMQKEYITIVVTIFLIDNFLSFSIFYDLK